MTVQANGSRETYSPRRTPSTQRKLQIFVELVSIVVSLGGTGPRSSRHVNSSAFPLNREGEHPVVAMFGQPVANQGDQASAVTLFFAERRQAA